MGFPRLEEYALVPSQGKPVLRAGLDVHGPHVGLPGEEIEEDPRAPVVVVAHHRVGVHPTAHDGSRGEARQDLPEDAAVVAPLETGAEDLVRHQS